MLREFRKKNSYLFFNELWHLIIVSCCIIFFYWWNPWNYSSLLYLVFLSLPLILNGPLGYLLTSLGVYFSLIPSNGIDFWLSIKLAMAGVFFGLIHSQIVHFCSHYLFRPRWLNRILGEILCLQFFGTFLGFTVLHLEHHAHADDLDLDPHPNQAEGFLPFLIRLSGTMAIGFERIYFRLHGKTPGTDVIWKRYRVLARLRCFSRAILFLVALGPTGFLFFLMPSMIANHWIFGHLNYYSHYRKADGTVDILNLNQKLLHKILNLFTLGAYNHGDHHHQPNSFKPSRQRQTSI